MRTPNARLPAPCGVSLERTTCGTPNGLINIPFDLNSGVPKEGVQERLASSWESQEFTKNGGGNEQFTLSQRSVERGLREGAESLVRVPQGNDDVRVDGSIHGSRSLRTDRITASRPEAIPGFPMPRYFPNGLLTLTGRTLILFPSPSNSSLSPGRTLKARRISSGTVICPLLVMRACFCISTSHPYFITTLLTCYLDSRLSHLPQAASGAIIEGVGKSFA